jgi:peptide deformylase
MEADMDEEQIARCIDRLEAVMEELDDAGIGMAAIHVSSAINALWKLANNSHEGLVSGKKVHLPGHAA